MATKDMKAANAKVVIVGAGMAGLSAAEFLYQHGFKNITLLEAKNRIGGRMQSKHFGSGPNDTIELGAQYIGGMVNSCSTYVLANQFGVECNKKAIDQPMRPSEIGHVYRSDGRVVDPQLVEDVNEYLQEWWFEMDEDEPGTMESSLRAYIKGTVMPEFDEEEKEDVRAIFNYFRNWLALNEGISPAGFKFLGPEEDDEEAYLVGDSVEVSGRMESLVDGVAARFPAGMVKMGRVVTKIVWGSGPPVTITAKLNGGTETYEADHVIVTIPLGYLKKYHSTIFQPSLPKEKVAAIDIIPFGHIGKVFFEYDHRWWNKDSSEMAMAWSDDEYKANVGSDWVKRITHFEGARQSPNTLLIWVAAEGATVMESLSEEQVVEDVTALLRQITRNPSIPVPRRCLKSTWINDPYTLGAYSTQGVSNNKHRIDLTRPLEVAGTPRVAFAGEATDQNYWGYMHGARDSGLREAIRLIKMYDSNKQLKRSRTSKL